MAATPRHNPASAGFAFFEVGVDQHEAVKALRRLLQHRKHGRPAHGHPADRGLAQAELVHQREHVLGVYVH